MHLSLLYLELLALWAAYRGANRLAVHGYTAQVFLCNTLGMICMGEQHAHIVVAMVNFVLLHAVVFGQRSALVVTGVLLAMLVISAQIDVETAYLIATIVGVEDAQRSISDATAFPSLLTTTLSTGYLIATTIHLKRQAQRLKRLSPNWKRRRLIFRLVMIRHVFLLNPVLLQRRLEPAMS